MTLNFRTAAAVALLATPLAFAQQKGGAQPEENFPIPGTLVIRADVDEKGIESNPQYAELDDVVVINDVDTAEQMNTKIPDGAFKNIQSSREACPKDLTELFNVMGRVAWANPQGPGPSWNFYVNRGGSSFFFGYGRTPYYGYHPVYPSYRYPTYGYQYAGYYYPYSNPSNFYWRRPILARPTHHYRYYSYTNPYRIHHHR